MGGTTIWIIRLPKRQFPEEHEAARFSASGGALTLIDADGVPIRSWAVGEWLEITPKDPA